MAVYPEQAKILYFPEPLRQSGHKDTTAAIYVRRAEQYRLPLLLQNITWPDENEEEFKNFASDLVVSLQPLSALDVINLAIIIDMGWRLKRLRRISRHVINQSSCIDPINEFPSINGRAAETLRLDRERDKLALAYTRVVDAYYKAQASQN